MRKAFSDRGGGALGGTRGIEKADEDQGGYQEGSVFGVGLERGFRDSQGGSINTDGNAVMSEAIQEGVQQEFALKEVIPFRIV